MAMHCVRFCVMTGLESLRREADKEANEAARVARTLHDIESKAFAAYAADLKEQEEHRPTPPKPTKKIAPVTKPLHKVKSLSWANGCWNADGFRGKER